MNAIRRAAWILVLAAVPAWGQEPLRLSLQQAIELAAENNLGVRIEQINVQISEQSTISATGLFDFTGTATLQRTSTEQPVTSIIFSPKSETDTFNFGMVQNLPTGGRYSVAFDNSKSDSTNPFRTFNPSYSSVLQLSLTQPLLRNFGVDTTTRSIRLARNSLGIGREQFRSQMLQTVLDTQQAFLDLVFAIENLKVKQESLDLAKDQERITQIRIDVGASAPLDILQPRVDIATREEEVIIAEAQIRSAEDRLRRLMNLESDQWNREIVPEYEIEFRPVRIEVDIAGAVERAYKTRPEVAQAELTAVSRQIDYQYRRNQRLPGLDLRVDYGFAGTGGTRLVDDEGNPLDPPISGGYDDAFEMVRDLDFPSWTVGLDLSIPVFNTTAKAEAKRAELDYKRAMELLEQTRQGIALEVRQAYRDIETAERRIAASRAARDSAEKNLDAERKRFDNGMTTNFEVLSAQRDLSDARSREVSAYVEYYKSVADLHKAMGDLLEIHEIEIESPEMGTSRWENWGRVSWLNYSRQSSQPTVE